MVTEERSVNITYETLFELVRLEKGKEELQKLDATFYVDVITYLREKYELLKEIKSSDQLFTPADKENTEKQIINIRHLLRDLYDRREKKIITMALNKTRVNAQIVDMQNMLSEEKKFYESLVTLLEKARKDSLMKILELRLPSSEEHGAVPKEASGEKHFTTPTLASPAAVHATKKETAKVKFIHPVPRFVGPELEEYGPFENEDIALLPVEVANVLVYKHRAIIIDEE